METSRRCRWLRVCLHRESKPISKAVASQHWSPDLAKVVLDNGIALDYLLAEQGGICVIGNTTCCIGISASGEVEIQWYMIKEQAHWVKQISPNDPCFFFTNFVGYFQVWAPGLEPPYKLESY